MSDFLAERAAQSRADRINRARGRRERRQNNYEVGIRAGQDLTPPQALALTEGVRKREHHRVWRGLAERGLIDPSLPFLPPMPDDWPLTPEGVRVRDELLATAKEQA